jgi:hypothetical protein
MHIFKETGTVLFGAITSPLDPVQNIFLQMCHEFDLYQISVSVKSKCTDVVIVQKGIEDL